MILVVLAATLAILGLLVLQVWAPLALGPWGLVAVALLDLSLWLGHRYRRAVRRAVWGSPPRYPLVRWGPVDRRYRTRRVDALEKEITAAFVFAVFLAALYVTGEVVRIDALVADSDINLLLFGSIMAMIPLQLLNAYIMANGQWAPRFDLEDTTDDH